MPVFSPSPSPMPDTGARNKRFGHYEIIRPIGRGGMGKVWEAFDTHLNRHVAIKTMLAGASASPDELARFRREAENSGKLRHPNIVPIHDVGREGDEYYLVMAYVDGPTLHHEIYQSKRPLRGKIRILEKVARAVQYAHEQGIIHRDLKPANIMLERLAGASRVGGTDILDEEPMVLDFGLAKNLKTDSVVSIAGTVIGTTSYMPPEQALGKMDKIGPASDVYSLGAILYEMLANRAPFVGLEPVQAMRAITEEEPAPPRQFDPSIPKDLETIALKCLEKDPRKRYTTAAEFADDLRAWLHAEPISARPPTYIEQAYRRVRRRPVLYSVAATVLLGILTSASWYFTRPGRVELKISPAHATVTINGEFILLKQGELVRDLPAGRHRLRVEAPDHRTIDEPLTVLRFTTDKHEITLRAASGFLQVAADQPDATVTIVDGAANQIVSDINGQKIERLALPRVIELREGPCRIRVEKLGFNAPDVSVDIPHGKTTVERIVKMYDLRAAISIDCTQANVQAVFERVGTPKYKEGPITLPIDGKKLLRLPAGEYEIKYTSDDDKAPRWDRTRTMSFQQNERCHYQVELQERELWSVKVDNPTEPMLGDLNGDGIPDVVVGSLDMNLYAFSGADGKQFWKFGTYAQIGAGAALADCDGDGRLDCIVNSGVNVYAVSGMTGIEIWKFKARAEMAASPAVADFNRDGRLDCGVQSSDGMFYALKGESGAVIWSAHVNQVQEYRPAIADFNGDGVPDCVVAAKRNGVYAISGKNGAELWHCVPGQPVTQRVVITDLNKDGVGDCAVVAENLIEVYSGKDGTNIWHVITPGGWSKTPLWMDVDGDSIPDCIAGPKKARVLSAYSGRDKHQIWSARLDGDSTAAPVPVEIEGSELPGLLIPTLSRDLELVSPKDGIVRARYPLSRLYGRDLAVADLDGDNFLDWIWSDEQGVIQAFAGRGEHKLWSISGEMLFYGSGPTFANCSGAKVPDCIVGGGWARKGSLSLFSGSDGRRLWRVWDQSAVWGWPRAADFNADGVPDFATWTTDFAGGCVAVNSGKNGERLQSYLFDQQSFRNTSPAFSDLDKDRVPDCVASNFDGKVYALSGKTGSLLWTFHKTPNEYPGVKYGSEVYAMSAPELCDLDGDGSDDCIVGSANSFVYAISGKDGTELWKFKTGGAIFVSPVLADLDSDGTLDCIIGSADGVLYTLSGRTGKVLWRFRATNVVMTSAGLGDLNRDGIEDGVIQDANGQVFALSGADGAVIWSRVTNGLVPGLSETEGSLLDALQRFVFSRPLLGDIDGDKIPDCVIGTAADVYALSGKDGRQLWILHHKAQIFPAALVDLDSDGRPETVYSTTEGAVHALSGTRWRLRDERLGTWCVENNTTIHAILKSTPPPVVCKPGELLDQNTWSKKLQPAATLEERKHVWDLTADSRKFSELKARLACSESVSYEELSTALRVHPNWAEGYLFRSILEKTKGNDAGAKEDFYRAVKIGQTDAYACSLAGMRFNELKEYEFARQLFIRAVGLAREIPRYHVRLAQSYLSCPDATKRDPRSALYYAQTAVSLSNSEDPECLDLAAQALFQNGRLLEAIEYQRKALAQAHSHSGQAGMAARLVQYESALESLHKK